MASFNDPYERKQEETYLNYSRGADAPDALRRPIAPEADASITNFGNVFLGAFEAKDTIYKDRIRKEVTTDVDAYRDAVNGTSTSSGSPNANVPADLRKQIDRMNGVVQAGKQGLLTDKAYWMQMENIARATRSRYPGYREYIDNVVSDITGGTPANVLQNMVAAEQTSLKDSDSKARDYALKGLLGHGVNVRNPENYSTDELEEMFAKKELIDKKLEHTTKQLAIRSASMALEEKEVEYAADRAINDSMAFDMKELTDSYLRNRDATVAKTREGSLTGEDLLKAQTDALAFENARVESATRILSRFNLSPKAFQERINAVKEQSRAITSSIINGTDNITNAYANRIKVQNDMSDWQILYENPNDFFRTMSTISRNGGSEVANMYMSQNAENLSEASKFVSTAHVVGVMNRDKKEVPTLDAHTKAVQEEPRVPTAEKGATLNNTIYNQTFNLGQNVGLPMEDRARIATSLFGPGNENILSRINDADESDVATFQRLNTPDVVKGMIELRDAGYTKEWNDYINWRDLSFKYLYASELDTMKGLPSTSMFAGFGINSDGSIRIDYNQPTGTSSPGSLDLTRTPELMRDRLSMWFQGAERTKDRLNESINALRPLWTAEGIDPAEETTRLLTMSGVNLNASKSPGTLYSFWTAFTAGLNVMTEAVTSPGSVGTPVQIKPEGPTYSAGGERNYRMPLGGPDINSAPKQRSDNGQRQLSPIEGIQAELEETLSIIQESPDPAVQEEARARYKGLQSDLKEAVDQQRKILDDLDNTLKDLNF